MLSRSSWFLRPLAPRRASHLRSTSLACAFALAVFTQGCAPTISKPRGTVYLDNLTEAAAHQHHGRLEEAAASYQKAAETAERKVDKDEALYRESRTLARMGKYPEAIAICDALGAETVIARRTLRARLDAARYRLSIGETEKADADLTSLMIDEPESAAARSALRMLAIIHVDQVEDKEAGLAWLLEMRNRVIDTSLGEPIMGAEAQLLLQMGKKDEARLLLERQVARYPYPEGARWDDALWQLADIALENENPKAAIGYLKDMVSKHEVSIVIASYTRPLMPKAALRIARIYRDDLRDNKAAVDAYEEVRSEFPRSTVVDDSLAEEAELRIAEGDKDKGCDLLRELMEKHEVGSARHRAESRITSVCN